MKRRVTTLFVFPLLGAIINVVVAWGFVLVHTPQSDWSPHYNPHSDPLLVHVTTRFGFERVVGVGRSGTLLGRYPEAARAYGFNLWWPAEAADTMSRAYAVAGGWPLLSLGAWRTTSIVDQGESLDFIPVIHWGFVGDRESFLRQSAIDCSEIVLPLRPIWPGFAINTLFYAAILWLFFAAPFALRRRLRRKRGLCPACAYPIGTSPVCTECGGPVGVQR